MSNRYKKTSPSQSLERLKDSRLFAFSLAFGCTFLVTSSVVQATDLQIYASPASGQKTIVLMLDTSGSMGPTTSPIQYDRWGNPIGYTGGYSYSDDYGLNTCGTLSQTALATQVQSLSGLRNNTAYRISSGTSPAYDQNFCYVSGDTTNNAVKNEVTGCKTIKNSNDAITGYQCFDRLTRLKNGLFALLDSNDADARSLLPDKGVGSVANLSQTYIGLGNFSAGGDGKSGQILVPSKLLGPIGSSQRLALKNGVAGLIASNGTPSAHAYAEAASYLLGTRTSVKQNKRFFRLDMNSDYYYQCNQTNANGTCSVNWAGIYSGFNSISGTTRAERGSIGAYSGYYYTDTDSGFDSSNVETKNSSTYNSPLPSEANKASCDGQGIYFLSDGAANSSDDNRALAMMQASLDTKGSQFACSNDLPNADGQSAWRCMGAYAKSLFDPTKNPKGRSIQTAFVGFGSTFSGNIATANQDAQNACRMSSRSYKDSYQNAPDDKCSPNYGGTLSVSAPTTNTTGTGRSDGYNYDGGFGNGGFFQASRETDITKSVITFINNLTLPSPSPLTTGAISVPVDDLSPNGFQPYGYMRALQPSPGRNYVVWEGNLKKYDIADGALKDSNTTIFNASGALNKTTKDKWSATQTADGGVVLNGGVFSKLSLPITTAPNSFRPLFTDVASASSGALTKMSYSGAEPNLGVSLLAVTGDVPNSAKLLDRFNTDTTIKQFTILLKVKLLNYLGYDLDLTTESLPTTLTAPQAPYTAMGGSIHSFPVQLTYSGTLDADGNLTSVRSQSVLYGSMEGGLRLVDSSSGKEQMVFVPADLLSDANTSSALRKGEAGAINHGVDGAWVVDAAYNFGEGTTTGTTSVKAKQMNVFGGMRMGGSSYYGLNVLNPSDPKFLFRIGSDLGGKYARMGQSWSKPVLANVRYDNKIKRVMFIGGGYDMCYENPRFKLGVENPAEYGGGCNKSEVLGNAVYMIDTNNGKVLWYASSAGADTNNPNMKHSIVSRIATLDRNADGLVDHLYFGDLGGQVFRADLNNAKNTATSAFGVRVVRLADLGSTKIANGDQPRFYQPPTVTRHTANGKIFILVGIASGDRSTPLDVTPKLPKDRVDILPSSVLTTRPVNNVYGLIDDDFANRDLMTIADTDLNTKEVVLGQLLKNPQTLSNVVANSFSPTNATGYKGWYRSLSSDYTGSEVAGKTAGGMKALEEEPVAISSYLLVPVYDPEGTVLGQKDPCQPRVIGETHTQGFCLPYGVCLKLDGNKDVDEDQKTGFKIISDPPPEFLVKAPVVPGIGGIGFGPKPGKGNCGGITMLGNTQGSGEWECNRILNPLRWYEKYVPAN